MSDRYENDTAWMDEARLWPDTDDLRRILASREDRRDLERLRTVARKHDAGLSYMAAAMAWFAHSQDYSASWLIVSRDDEALWKELEPWIARAQRREMDIGELIVTLEPHEFDSEIAKIPAQTIMHATKISAQNYRSNSVIFVRGESPPA